MKHPLFGICSLLCATLLVVGCGTRAVAPPGDSPTKQPAIVSHGGPVKDYVSFIDTLRAAGAKVELTGEVEQPFFTVTGQTITVNAADVQVFEFADDATAQAAASKVGPDGSSFETTMVTWIDSPHFFRTGRIIVLYVGQATDLLKLLSSTLGPQFAGR